MKTSVKMGLCVAIVLCVFLGSCMVERSSFASQFTILYSLDKKQNDRALVNVINDAHQYVYFAIYTFTKENIAAALVNAKERGLDVQGIADAEQSAMPQQAKIIASLRDAGISVETQKHPEGIMHIKALVTDNAYAIGSYNWTSAATYENDEILEIGTNDELRKEYMAILQKIFAANR
jgi:phosphatidylserine/phosphatidylglycerophosphate/cardiolipin synthase-like enzyme